MARAAMNSVEGIQELHMSGRRAVFVLEPGEQVDEGALAAAFESQGLKLASVERTQLPDAKAMLIVDTGVT